MFKNITIAFDNAGCPNRCKHCWLGVHPNKDIPIKSMTEISHDFRRFSEHVRVDTWVREPDYPANYRELWDLSNDLSYNQKPTRFELCSFYRINRDETYIDWLKLFEVDTYQLTVFGGKKQTDHYVGRKGAFEEIMNATNLLLDNGLIPRWQMFLTKDNIDEVDDVLNLISDMNLRERCNNLGKTFEFFIHVGSIDGENTNQYDQWITKSDLPYIPKEYFKGQEELITEKEICEKYKDSDKINNIVSNEPVFYISADLDVFPNYTEMSPWWSLGNLKTDSLDKVLNNYTGNKSIAQKATTNVTYGELVNKYGNFNSERLFHEEDFITYLLNRHCKEQTNSN